MKVWFITMAFPMLSETFARNNVLALRRAGVEVSVHALRPGHRYASQLLSEWNLTGVWVTHGSIRSMLRGLWIGLTRPGLLFSLILWLVQCTWNKPSHLLKSLFLTPRSIHLFALIEQEHPDVVHLYWGHYPSLVGHLVQTKLPNTVVSVTLGAYDLIMEYGCSGPVARSADMVTTLTLINVPGIESLGVSRSSILISYDGLSLAKISTTEQQKVKRRIVTAGRLVPDKGMDDVLRVFSEILAYWPDASLVILGDGTERRYLAKLADSLGIGRAVTFRGHIPYDSVFEEMAAAEVFLFMSKDERLPNVVKEAMACRCLCVVAETPGIEELLRDGQHGYVVAQEDIEAAAQRIDKVFSDMATAQQMLEAAQAHLIANFDVDRVMQNLRDRWQQLLDLKRITSELEPCK